MQWIGGREVSWRLIAFPLVTLLLALGLLTAKSSTGQVVGGPVAVLGIDAEDTGGGGHGPISTYVALVNGILGNVVNGETGILVIGGGKFPSDPDDVTAFWTAIGTAIPTHPVTFVNNETVATAIANQSFAGFALIAVASSATETPDGGLTPAENTALVGRADDIATFVDGGGGVLGFTQSGIASPYLYLGGIGGFVATTGLNYQNITVTAEGTEVGLSDALDVCCWHDELTSFPSFLMPLATNPATGNVVAVGGSRITFDTTTSSSSTTPASTSTSTPATSTTSTVAATTTTRLPTTTSTTRQATSTTSPRLGATSTTAVRRPATTGTMPLSS
jgi:trimeric autotransporter adhesin